MIPVTDEGSEALREKAEQLERRWLAVKNLMSSQRERATGLIQVEHLQSGMATLFKDIESKRRFIDSCEGIVIEDDLPELSANCPDDANITKKLRECQVSECIRSIWSLI